GTGRAHAPPSSVVAVRDLGEGDTPGPPARPVPHVELAGDDAAVVAGGADARVREGHAYTDLRPARGVDRERSRGGALARRVARRDREREVGVCGEPRDRARESSGPAGLAAGRRRDEV